MSQKYRWDWENNRTRCVIYDGQDQVATAIGPVVAQRLVEKLNAYDAFIGNMRKSFQQELVREQAARDAGCVEGVPV